MLTWQELGDIVGLSMDNDPAGVLGVVLGNFRACKLRHDRSICTIIKRMNGYPEKSRRLQFKVAQMEIGGR